MGNPSPLAHPSSSILAQLLPAEGEVGTAPSWCPAGPQIHISARRAMVLRVTGVLGGPSPSHHLSLHLCLSCQTKVSEDPAASL